MEKDVLKKLTLEDIENMVRILEYFLRVSRRVETLLRRLEPYRSRGFPFSPERIMETVVSSTLQQRLGIKQGEIEEEEPFSEEELKEIEKTISKIKSGQIREV